MEVCDLALLMEDMMIIADLHLGYEQYLNQKGFMLPSFQFKKIIDRIDNIKELSGADNIIINGDLKHEFGRVSRQEDRELKRLIDYLKENFKKITLIKGNHDPIIPYISHLKNFKILETMKIQDSLITHGHFIPEKIETKRIIIGHEHPCIGLRSGERIEKIKCYLEGPFEDKKLIVMPSFNFVSEGSDILHEAVISPFLKKVKLSQFRVYAVENFKIFEFGRLGDISKIMELPKEKGW
ncbi:MAG TPA: metallophosphoesterase [Methanothermobacter sp.]|nr:metallophosphoesterase [Methanothermobacter sp.]HOL69548.1 metallophosphoesterase [Methanothermobacter sp.]HPQ05119.1 metallophosphoesterase [Methanothermobacter sp.]HPU37334.1 metallophosphoesterase [Methanothermobacter sp.]